MTLKMNSDTERKPERTVLIATRSRAFVSGATMLASCVLLVSTSTVAFAAEPRGVEAIAAQVEEAAAVVGAAPALSERPELSVDVDFPTTAGGDIVFQREGQLPISVSLPDIQTKPGKTAGDGTTVFEGTGNNPDISVASTDSGFRISTVIASESQPTEYVYALNDGTTAELQPDGSVYLLREEPFEDGETSGVVSVVVGVLKPAWAIDANQDAVPTSYEVIEGAVVQHVEHGSGVVYPVVADPQAVVTGVLQVRVRWTRGETKSLKDCGYGATALTAGCLAAGNAIAGPVGGAVGAGICAVAGVGLVLNASNAYNSGRCLEWWIQFVPIGLGGSVAVVRHLLGRLLQMTERVSARQPLRDWRWWLGFVFLLALAFAAGRLLYGVGFDSGAAGAIASAPLFAFAILTALWRRRSMNSHETPR